MIFRAFFSPRLCLAGALVCVGFRNDEEDVLGLPDGHPSHSRHLLQPKLGHDLSCLLFSTTLLAPFVDLLICTVSSNLSISYCFSFFQVRNGVIVISRFLRVHLFSDSLVHLLRLAIDYLSKFRHLSSLVEVNQAV